MNEQSYVGEELALFAEARHWKDYWVSKLRPHIHGTVLEAGAGLGTNTLLLRGATGQRWVCLEPDPKLSAALRQRIGESALTPPPEARTGTLDSLPVAEQFDTIIYIDVLEHIEDDRGEVRKAASHLNAGGRLIVLAPAHPWLFSPFDQAIGHYRRYTAPTLAGLTPPGLRLIASFYLDSVGLLASAANRLFLRQSIPSAKQLRCWDNFMVPSSRVVDRIVAFRLGKTVVCVWEREG